jgi:hypothetical protein
LPKQENRAKIMLQKVDRMNRRWIMSVREVTLREIISLSRRLSPTERLRLISILSDELSREAVVEAPPEPTADDEEAQMLAELRAAGLLMDPTPEMLARAAAWDALSESEKQEAIEALRNLELDPSLSEIVISRPSVHHKSLPPDL